MSGRTLRVSLIQQAGLSVDREEARARLLAEIERAAADAVDLVLPTELSLTPYFPVHRDPAYQNWKEPLDGEVLSEFRDSAARFGVSIALPLFVDGGRVRGENAVVLIGPDGEIVEGVDARRRRHRYFSKVHLPHAEDAKLTTDEPFHFIRGDAFPCFELPQGRIGFLICYDRRFPEAWRTLALQGAELVLVPSCVPAWNPAEAASSGATFVSELQTRACENMFFVAACNRAGAETLDGRISNFVGRSCFIGPGGTLIDQAPSHGACTLTQTLDLDQVARARRRLTVLEDRIPEAYAFETGPVGEGS